MKLNHPDIDVIIVNGDFSAHGVSLKTKHGYPTRDKMLVSWSKMKKLMSNSLKVMKENFPNAAILPSLGNNDVVLHNEVPCSGTQFKNKFYKEFYEVWFPEGEWGDIDFSRVKESFLEGGYYAYDFPKGNLTFVALNTLMFTDDNICDK